MKQRLSKIFAITFTVIYCNINILSYAQTDASKVKAIWVHTLTSYIKWEERNDNVRTICTKGLDRTYQYLKEIQDQKTSSFKLIEKGNRASLKECDLLYIATSEINNVGSILENTHPSLVTVSDIKNFAESGGVIELVHKEGSVKLNINIKSAKEKEIIINSDLLAVSTIINH